MSETTLGPYGFPEKSESREFIDNLTANLNSFHIGETALEAMFDRVLVLVDVFKSGYECTTCGGEQKVPCDNCDAGRSRVNSEVVCKLCHGSQTVPCPTCQGKGVKEGGIVVPETAQNPPQAGTIVSVGEDVGRGVHRLFGAVRVEARPESTAPLKIGDRVMFGRFAGHDLTLSTTDGKSVPLRLLNESEVLCRIEGTLELRKMGKSTKEELL